MSISVDQLFKEFNLTYSEAHRWNQKLDADFNGVYIISTSADPFKHNSIHEINISPDAFAQWKKEAPDLEIEGTLVTDIEQVKSYLNKFWHKTENIIYIGESTSKTNPLQRRINQYYIHKVGQKGPHTGGYWVKLLSCLDDLYIYIAECSNPRETEFKMILKFSEILSGRTIFETNNLSTFFPFANAKVDLFKKNSIKNHINTNSRKAKKSG
jgi:hypothetical protein